MLTDYQLSALGQIWVVLLVPTITPFLYWFYSKNQIVLRAITSSHGAILLSAFFYAVAVSPRTGFNNWESWIIPFYMLLFVYVISIVVSLFKFKGNRWVHIALTLELPSAFLIWLVGTMTITHDWM